MDTILRILEACNLNTYVDNNYIADLIDVTKNSQTVYILDFTRGYIALKILESNPTCKITCFINNLCGSLCYNYLSTLYKDRITKYDGKLCDNANGILEKVNTFIMEDGITEYNTVMSWNPDALVFMTNTKELLDYWNSYNKSKETIIGDGYRIGIYK
jgi:hypothetical protein